MATSSLLQSALSRARRTPAPGSSPSLFPDLTFLLYISFFSHLGFLSGQAPLCLRAFAVSFGSVWTTGVWLLYPIFQTPYHLLNSLFPNSSDFSTFCSATFSCHFLFWWGLGTVFLSALFIPWTRDIGGPRQILSQNSHSIPVLSLFSLGWLEVGMRTSVFSLSTYS